MNLYWPVYKKLEADVLLIAGNINFSEDQLQVYSIRIADVIVRCAVEIEAISKELYKRLGGDMKPVDKDGKPRDVYFDTDCLNLINQTWLLDQKRIMITTAAMHFQKPFHLYPLRKSGKRGTSGSKWKRAYQALKHNRHENLKKGTVENMLNALGALYILNLYYADEIYDVALPALGVYNETGELKSDVFEPLLVNAYMINWDEAVSDNNIIWDQNEYEQKDEAILILKISENDYMRLHKEYSLGRRRNLRRYMESELIQSFLSAHPELSEEEPVEVCLRAAGERFKDMIFQDKLESIDLFTTIQCVVNKNKNIYPVLEKIDVDVLDAEISSKDLY